MERVKKGEKYWIITQIGFDFCCVPVIAGEFKELDNDACNKGNRFHTKEEAEAMARKLRAVLKGADVIEMPSEEDAYNEEFKTNPYFFGKDGAAVVGAHQEGFNHCFEWLKSKIVK